MKRFAFIALVVLVGTVLADNASFYASPNAPSAPKTYPVNFSPWTAIAVPATNPDRLTHVTVEYNGKIYMIGGTPNGQAGSNVTTCQEYDPVANTWTDRAPMTTARGWIDGAVVKGKIYVIGGYTNAGGVTAVNEEFDPVANSWRGRAARPRATCASLNAVWRDTLVYVCGGYTGSGIANVDIYNPATNTWATGTAINEVGDMGDAVIIGDTIYAIALNRGTNQCWANLKKGAINPTTPTTITWSNGPAMTPPNSILGMAALGGDVYWAGGFENLSTVTASCWRYNRTSGSIEAYDTYTQPLARCTYMTSIPSRNELYVMAGDLNGDWNPPNNLYSKSSLVALEENLAAKRNRSLVRIEETSPNPTSGASRIAFSVPRSGRVDLALFNAQGQLVQNLVGQNLAAGRHSVSMDCQGMSAGVYFLRLAFEDVTTSGKVTVIK